MEFTTDYQRREWIGRQALKELQRLNPTTFKHNIIFEPDEYSVFDASFISYDYTTHKVVSRIFIEIKIRDTIYPDYILEKKKVNNLHKKMKELHLEPSEYRLYYLNFTPSGALLWNISDIQGDDCTDTKFMNKATSSSRTNKQNKSYKAMKPEDAKRFDYIIDSQDLFDQETLRTMKPLLEKIVKKKGFGFLFD